MVVLSVFCRVSKIDLTKYNTQKNNIILKDVLNPIFPLYQYVLITTMAIPIIK